mgnify:CR=1 FL=1
MKKIKPRDWKQVTSKNHCPTVLAGCNTSHWVLPIGRGQVEIWKVSLPIVSPHDKNGDLGFTYSCDFGANSDNSYTGLVYASDLESAKKKVVEDVKRNTNLGIS